MSFFLAFVGFAALIILHEAGHFAAAKAVGMRVERFSLFFPPLIARKRVGETEYAIGALPLGGYVKITGMNPDERLPDEVRTRAYTAQPVWKRVVVIAAGPAMNLVLAFAMLLGFFWLIGAPTESTSTRVERIEPGMPAAATVRPGDRLLAVDGKRGGPRELIEAVAAHRCPRRPPTDGCRAAEPARILLLRDGRRVEVEVTPVYDRRQGRTRVGLAYPPGPRDPVPLGRALEVSATQFWLITRETVKLPARLLDAERRKELTGVVGSYEVTRQRIEDDIGDAVFILALISLSLAIVNLFPFLPLDGGHIFWAAVEKVRRRPVPYRVMERAGVVGLMLVFVVFLIALTNDVERLSNGGFEVR